MPRRLRQPGVYGPYAHGDRFRIHLVNERGETTYQSYATEREALQVRRALQRELNLVTSKTVNEAIDMYEVYLSKKKENKAASRATTLSRLRAFFPDREVTLDELTPKRCASYYADFT